MARKRPRRWIWLIVVVVLFGLAGVFLAYRNRDRYAFLERFHPQHLRVDYGKLFGSLPGNRALPKLTVLVFRGSDHAAVLAAMRRELTPSNGFRSSHTESDAGTVWQFERSASSGASYDYGPHAASELEMLRSGSLGSFPSEAEWRSKPVACIVTIAER